MATATATAAVPRRRRLGRLERAALQGVMVREIVNFSSFWRSSTFSSTVDPTIYLLAFGFGFGSLVSTVAGYSYIDFVGTGIVATTVLFSGAFPAMYSTFVKYQFQHTYDAILAAPVDVEELVTAEALWIAARTGTYGCVPMLVAIVFGLDPSWGMLLVPFIAALAGYGWACFGIFIAAKAKAIESFSYWQSGLLTPMFLVAGTFFPVDGLPEWAQVASLFNPLFHCVQLVRHAVFGFQGWEDLGHLAFLVVFALVAWRLAIRSTERARTSTASFGASASRRTSVCQAGKPVARPIAARTRRSAALPRRLTRPADSTSRTAAFHGAVPAVTTSRSAGSAAWSRSTLANIASPPASHAWISVRARRSRSAGSGCAAQTPGSGGRWPAMKCCEQAAKSSRSSGKCV
jgi:lipooligosaccharide transport system permease protein